MRVLGIYREAEFSPGKVADDRAILDAVLAELAGSGLETEAVDPRRFTAGPLANAHLVLAMCQGERALERLAQAEEAGAITINSALAIRNCYRDLLGSGLIRAGVPTPVGRLIDTGAPARDWQLDGLEVARGVYLKRGDLHALSANDVQRVDDLHQLAAACSTFARRGIRSAYVQQAVSGRVIKFYGVSGDEFFTALPESGALADAAERRLKHAAAQAAEALGLQVWGGDALLDGNEVKIVDFNDWPSFGRVRREAARAIARRSILLLRRLRRNN